MDCRMFCATGILYELIGIEVDPEAVAVDTIAGDCVMTLPVVELKNNWAPTGKANGVAVTVTAVSF